jgi:hypothetical protein
MKKYLTLFLLFLGVFGYAQDVKNIEITLESGDVKTTNWINLKETPTFQKPFLTVDSISGQKIKIKDIKSYKGYDQNGYYRQLQKIDLNQKGRFRFTELMFRKDSTEAVKIYYNKNTFALEAETGNKTYFQYQLKNKEIKKLTYKNINQDFIDLNYKSESLDKAKQIKILQYTSMAIATGLLGYYIIDNEAPYKGSFMKNDFAFYTAGVFFVLPFALEKTKKDKLTDALKNYN